MKPPVFEYHRADSLAHACELLTSCGDDVKILAGGQTLIPMLNFRLARPEGAGRHLERARAQPGHGRGRRHSRLRDDRPAFRGKVAGRAEAVAVAVRGDPAHRAFPDPQQGHDRRQHRQRRSGIGTAGDVARLRRRARGHQQRRHAGDPGRGALHHLHDDVARPRRGAVVDLLSRAAGRTPAGASTRSLAGPATTRSPAAPRSSRSTPPASARGPGSHCSAWRRRRCARPRPRACWSASAGRTNWRARPRT